MIVIDIERRLSSPSDGDFPDTDTMLAFNTIESIRLLHTGIDKTQPHSHTSSTTISKVQCVSEIPEVNLIPMMKYQGVTIALLLLVFIWPNAGAPLVSKDEQSPALLDFHPSKKQTLRRPVTRLHPIGRQECSECRKHDINGDCVLSLVCLMRRRKFDLLRV
ncbi:hypothetical protein FHG87_008588 [Trinorchestia longiramus]|nr:hypothetical protein FHG87_008588 [Trinorchestia longiramus]